MENFKDGLLMSYVYKRIKENLDDGCGVVLSAQGQASGWVEGLGSCTEEALNAMGLY